MKTEVLKNIKTTEEEYQSRISTVMAERKRSISDAELEADNLIMKAGAGADEFKKLKLAEARESAEKRRREIIAEGDKKAADLRLRGSQNLPKAVELLVSRFKEKLNVKA